MKNAKNLILFSFFSFCLFISCEKEDGINPVPIEDNAQFKVSVLYVLNETEMVDFNSKVFVYYNRNIPDFTEYKYVENGVFSNEKSEILPDLTYQIGLNGYVEVETGYIKNNDFFILAESNFYKGRIIHTYFDNFEKGMELRFKFR